MHPAVFDRETLSDISRCWTIHARESTTRSSQHGQEKQLRDDKAKRQSKPDSSANCGSRGPLGPPRHATLTAHSRVDRNEPVNLRTAPGCQQEMDLARFPLTGSFLVWESLRLPSILGLADARRHLTPIHNLTPAPPMTATISRNEWPASPPTSRIGDFTRIAW